MQDTLAQPLRRFGLDCWGWYLVVEALDEEDARARAVAAADSKLGVEMAEMANVRLLEDE